MQCQRQLMLCAAQSRKTDIPRLHTLSTIPTPIGGVPRALPPPPLHRSRQSEVAKHTIAVCWHHPNSTRKRMQQQTTQTMGNLCVADDHLRCCPSTRPGAMDQQWWCHSTAQTVRSALHIHIHGCRSRPPPCWNCERCAVG